MPDDFTNDVSTTGVLTVNQPFSALVDATGDQDWFAVQLVQGTKYRIDVTGLHDTHIGGIYDQAGTLIPGTVNYSGGVGRDARVWFEAPATGTYYVSAGLAAGVAVDPADNSYDIAVRDAWDDHPDDATTTARVVLDGTPFAGAIDEDGDIDWIGVELVAGRVYNVALRGGQSTGNGPVDVRIEGVYSDSGARLAGAVSGSGDTATVSFFPPTTGTYYIAAGSEGTARNGLYEVSVAGEAIGSLGVGQSGFGRINGGGDLDYYRIQMTEGMIYRIEVDGLNDSHIGGVYGPDGRYIAGTENYSGGIGRDARLDFRAPADGEYVVAVGVANGYFGDNGNVYEVTVRTDWDDIPANAAGAAATELGAVFRGSIDDNSDIDWIGVRLVAGETYRIALTGRDSTISENGQPLPLDVRMAGVYTADGTREGAPGSGSGNTVTSLFKPETSGTYYVAAGSEGAVRRGFYDLVVTQESDVRLGVNQVGFGTIDGGGDQDLFTLQLTGGTQYRIDVTGIGDGHIGGVFGPDGQFIEGTVNYSGGIGRDARLWFTPSADGLYTLSAGAAPGASGDIGGRYSVSVFDNWDDSAENPQGAAFAELGVPFQGVIDDSADVDWIGVALEPGVLYQLDIRGGDSTRSQNGRPIPVDVKLEGLYDATGTRVMAENSGGPTAVHDFFTVSNPGTYYVAVAAEGAAHDGHYTMSVTQVPVTDLALNTPRTAEGANSTDDRHVFEVELTAGTQYRIDATHSYYNTYVTGILDDEGNLMAGTTDDNSGVNNNARVFFTPTESGRYHVVAGISPDAPAWQHARLVAVSVSDQFDDFAADVTTAANPANWTVDARGRETTAGSFDMPDDQDWIGLDLTAGETVWFNATGGNSNRAGYTVAPRFTGLFDATGAAVDVPALAGSGVSGFAFQAAQDGRYFLQLAEAGGEDQGSYGVSVGRDLVAGDVTSTAAYDWTQSNASSNYRVTGIVNAPSDQDWIRVSTTAGQTYELVLSGHVNVAGVFDAAGTALAGVPTGARSFVAQTTGDVFVAIGARDDRADTDYSLRIHQDDYSNTPQGNVGMVAVNGRATGAIERSYDVDYFAADLTAGVRYRIDLEGSPTRSGTLRDTYLGGVYFNGVYAGGANDDSGYATNSLSYFTAAQSGVHHISARGYYSNIGTYRLTLSVADDDFRPDPTTVGRVAVGADALGVISYYNDTDGFLARGMAGTPYRVRVDGDGGELASLTQYSVRVVDAANQDLSGGAISHAGAVNLSHFVMPGTGEALVQVTGRAFPASYSVALEALDVIGGTAGNDWITVPTDDLTDLGLVAGGTGVDMVSLTRFSGPARIDLEAGTVRVTHAGADHRFALSGIEGATGTRFNDTFIGIDGSEKLRGLGGRDLFYGSAGARDTLDGGSSNDTVSYANSAAAVSVSLLRGRGWGGDADGDRLSNIENVIGSAHDDMIWGDALANRLEGGTGNDTLTGNGGNDYISAGLGVDVVVYSGNQADYRIAHSGIRTEVEHLNGGADGFDIIGHAEILRFADGDLIL